MDFPGVLGTPDHCTNMQHPQEMLPTQVVRRPNDSRGRLLRPADAGPADRAGEDRTIPADGLTYPSLTGASWRQWLHLLVHHTLNYMNQSMSMYRAETHSAWARDIYLGRSRA